MIYCVEDDLSIRELIVYTLKNTGFEAVGIENGDILFLELTKTVPQLILLDIMLPCKDGIEILKELKSNNKTSQIPVIMLTAKGTEYDKVIGLDSGADDYITKPFGMMELVSRIKAVLRRAQCKEQSEVMAYKNVLVDLKKHMVYVNNKPVELTNKEFMLLEIMLSDLGRVFTRDILLNKIWGYEYDCETRTVDVHIRSLRMKLGNGGDIIHTVRGIGYRIGGVE